MKKFLKNKFFLILIIILISIQSNAYGFQYVPEIFKGIFQKHGKILKKNNYKRISRLENNIIRRGKYARVAHRDVIYNDNLFKNSTSDGFLNNCQRMSIGRAPIGTDGIEVSLHHLQQRNDGIIVEMLTSEHSKHSKSLHQYKKHSEINRDEFSTWRKSYWRERWMMRCR